jgi:hypothetical protein
MRPTGVGWPVIAFATSPPVKPATVLNIKGLARRANRRIVTIF